MSIVTDSKSNHYLVRSYSRITVIQASNAGPLPWHIGTNQHYFCTFVDLTMFMKESIRVFQAGGPHYFAVTHFGPKDYDLLVSRPQDFPEGDVLMIIVLALQLYVIYSRNAEAMIIKTMPGLQHEIAVNKISDLVKAYLVTKAVPWDTLCTTGSGRFLTCDKEKPGKEADQSYKPMETQPGVDAFPSFVIKVGVCQGLKHLRLAAQNWLIHTNKQTQLVLLVSILIPERQIKMERWELVPNTSSRPARSETQEYCPALQQELILFADGTIQGAPASNTNL